MTLITGSRFRLHRLWRHHLLRLDQSLTTARKRWPHPLSNENLLQPMLQIWKNNKRRKLEALFPKNISFVCHVTKLFSLLAPMCPVFSGIRQLYSTVWGSWEFNPKHNVFTGVCLFLEGGIPMQPLPIMYRTSLYSLQLPPPPALDIRPGLPANAIWWSLLETCSNLFI